MDEDRVLENKICAKNWPELVDQAEQRAKSFASANNLQHEINLQKYKKLSPKWLVLVRLYYTLDK